MYNKSHPYFHQATGFVLTLEVTELFNAGSLTVTDILWHNRRHDPGGHRW
jgi:hypothetical protein